MTLTAWLQPLADHREFWLCAGGAIGSSIHLERFGCPSGIDRMGWYQVLDLSRRGSSYTRRFSFEFSCSDSLSR